MNSKELTIEQLKAIGFDAVKQQSQAQQTIQAVEQELARREQEEKPKGDKV